MKKKNTGRLLALLLALLTALALLPTAAFAASTGSANTVLENTLTQERASLTNPEFGSEWVVLGLARSGNLDKGSKLFAVYYENIVTYVNTQAAIVNKDGALHAVKCTENSRLILALSALGRSAEQVGEWNLFKPYEDFNWVSGQGINSVIFALIAFDAADYHPETNDIRQRCISYILNRQLSDGGWAYREEDTSADPDMTAMALQALAPYTAQDAVSAAANSGIACLSALQNADGSYTSYEAVNSESIAQVIVACTALGIDPNTDARFVKGGSSAVDALLRFYDSDKRAFHHVMVDKDGNPTGVDGMATEQAAYALTAYQRFVNGKSSLYDMSDVTKDCAGEHKFGDWTQSAATCTEPAARVRVCKLCGRSEVEEVSPARGHRAGSEFEMSDEHHWVVCTICGAHLDEAEHRYVVDQCAVCGYHKLGGRITVNYMTAVPETLKNNTALNSVDKIESSLFGAALKVSSACTAKNSVTLDVRLMIPSTRDGQTVWTAAGKSNFPANGKITILLPYPTGTSANEHDFVVTHLFMSDDFGKKTGELESPLVKETADGLQVTLTGLSPIMICWKTPGSTTGAAGGVKTGDGAQLTLWLSAAALSCAALALLPAAKKKRSTH